MAKTEKNWTLNSYTNSEWTSLVAEVAAVATVIIANCSTDSPGTRTVQLRVADTSGSPDTSLARVLAPVSLASGETKTFDSRSLNIAASQALQVHADGADVDFFVSGVIDA